MNNFLEIITHSTEVLVGTATVAVAIFAVMIHKWIHQNEKNDSITSKTISCLIGLFPEYKETMKKINNALEEAKELKKFLGDCENNFSEFNNNYYSPKYDNFRDVHYFFEMLGSLVTQKEINRHTFWHYFTFPLDYFMKTRDLRMIIIENNCLPTYAQNFCRLFIFYNEKRKKDGEKWVVNGKTYDPFDEEDVLYYTGEISKKLYKKNRKLEKHDERNLYEQIKNDARMEGRMESEKYVLDLIDQGFSTKEIRQRLTQKGNN